MQKLMNSVSAVKRTHNPIDDLQDYDCRGCCGGFSVFPAAGAGLAATEKESRVVRAVVTQSGGVCARFRGCGPAGAAGSRSEEHTSELQSHSFISYAVFCLKKKQKCWRRSDPLPRPTVSRHWATHSER